MIPKYKVLLISLIVFLPVFITIPTTESNNSSNKTSGFTIPFPVALSDVKYSTWVDQNNSLVHIYTAYQYNSSLVLSNSTIAPYYSSTTKELLAVNTTSLIGPNTSIADYNFFISKNTPFLILSYQKLSTFNNNITIFDLSNNRSFEAMGNSTYHISSINRFSNSPNIYFSYYNRSTFYIVKYDFQTDAFSTILNQTIPNNNYYITNVNTFMLNEKFYVSFTSETYYQFNLTNSTTYLYILNNNKGIVFNKTIPSIAVTSFTTFSDGLLLYSMYNSSYFQYFYSNDSLIPLSTILSNFQYYYFSPYDNNSYLALSFNQFNVININPYNSQTDYLQGSRTYIIQNSNNQDSIQAITINGNQYYLLSGLNQNNAFEIFFASILEIPSDFTPITTTSAPPITSTTDPFSYNSYSTSNIVYTTTTSSSPLTIFILLVIVFLVIGAIVVSVKKSRENQYYSPRDRSYLRRSQNYQSPYQQNQQKQPIQNLSCSRCGFPAESGDVFCQNCGSRL